MKDAREITVRLDSSNREAAWNLPADLGPALRVLRCEGRTGIARLYGVHGVEREWDDPLAALEWMAESARNSYQPDDRWVGFLSYELGGLFEPLVIRALPQEGELPLFVFTFHSRRGFHQPMLVEDQTVVSGAALRSNFSREEFETAVRRAVEYVGAGDIFQVNLAQRFTAGLTTSPEFIYERLRELFDAEYGAFLGYGDFSLLCNSPELFLRVSSDRRVITRPIKGTRPRVTGMDLELRESVKDQAELNMIVDLERNDLGRICEIGSVSVAQARLIEAHPTVFHGVATIEGVLRKDVTFVDVLRATFPGGSVTGAPKIRAMQIINELEPVGRGPYCGAIGYLSSDGTMEFNVAIRTMIIQDGLAHFSVGGGIVADSHPGAEYEETLVKATAMFGALGLGDREIGIATRGE